MIADPTATIQRAIDQAAGREEADRRPTRRPGPAAHLDPLTRRRVFEHLRRWENVGRDDRAIAEDLGELFGLECTAADVPALYEARETEYLQAIGQVDHEGVYLPTAEEIRDTTARIRAGWTDKQRLRRAGIRPLPLTVPLCPSLN